MTDQPPGTALEAFLSGFQRVLQQDDVPDYEITDVQNVNVRVRLHNGAEIEIDMFDYSMTMKAALRILFDPDDRQQAVLQFMAAGQNVVVRRSGSATFTGRPW